MQKIRENFALKVFDFPSVSATAERIYKTMTETENFRAENRKILPKREIFAKEKKEGKFRRNLSEGA